MADQIRISVRRNDGKEVEGRIELVTSMDDPGMDDFFTRIREAQRKMAENPLPDLDPADYLKPVPQNTSSPPKEEGDEDEPVGPSES